MSHTVTAGQSLSLRAIQPLSFPFLLVFSMLLLLASSGTQADENSFIAPRAANSLMLDVFQAPGGKFYAAGSRGHILHSLDGQSWTQVVTPTKQNLSAIFFADERKGWAVGHDATILSSKDGGLTWIKQFRAPEKEQPLFDVIFRNENEGMAIGAYGLFLTTKDGGNTWKDQYIEALDDETYGLPHFYKIKAFSAKIYYMVGEAGLVARSDDAGENWRRIQTPYRGSFFNMLVTDKNSLLVMGLRGAMYRSEDAGANWSVVKTNTVASLSAVGQLRDGTIIVAGMEGTFLLSRDDGQTFQFHQHPDRADYATLITADDSTLLLAGEDGLTALKTKSLSKRKPK